jgi:hypothetical protein
VTLWTKETIGPEFIEPLTDIRNQAVESVERLMGLYGFIRAESDGRTASADHIVAVLSPILISARHLQDNLSGREWWDQTVKQMQHGQPQAPLESGQIQRENDYYMSFLTTSFPIFLFSVFESGLRKLVRALDASACAGGGAEFVSIHEWLFKRLRKSGWTYPPGEEDAFLKLFRLMRNLQHNNGVYWDKYARNDSVTWRGNTCEFEHGRMPEFQSWDLSFAMARELIALNESIMSADAVVKLPWVYGLNPHDRAAGPVVAKPEPQYVLRVRDLEGGTSDMWIFQTAADVGRAMLKRRILPPERKMEAWVTCVEDGQERQLTPGEGAAIRLVLQRRVHRMVRS